jgi:pimeloyl-ACP methyl ester carboxylesterase
MIDSIIRRRNVHANGIDIHLAEAGDGYPVVLCHGFPESWYSWRHQIAALAKAGFRAIAPDMRGYGGTGAPENITDYSMFHLVGDMIGIVDALGLEKAAIIGHDWGAPVAWTAALMRPDRFNAVGALSVPFLPRGPMSGLEGVRRAGKHNFYQLYFQEPGKAEAEFEQDVEATMRRFLWTLSAGPETIWDGMIADGGAFATFPEPTRPMEWLSTDDLAFYTGEFRKKGFRGALNWYRNIDRNWALMAPFQGAVVQQPSMFVVGERDGVLPIYRPLVEALPRVLPDLRISTIVQGAGHWVQQEAPEQVNSILLRFLREVASEP